MRSIKKKFSLAIRLVGTILTALFSAGVISDLYQRYQYMLREPLTSWKISFFIVSLYTLFFLLVPYILIWRPSALSFFRRIRQGLGWIRWIGIILAAALVCWFFLFARWSEVFSGFYARVFVFLSIYAVMAFFACSDPEQNYSRSGCLSALVILSSMFASLTNFQAVTNYPFQLSWSEGNRLWDYSLLFGRDRYIYPIDKPIPSLTDLGRQSLWGLIFLLPNISIFTARLWSGLVWTVPYAIFGWLLFSHRSVNRGIWMLLGLWTFLFLNQGPIYSTLMVGAILVGLSRKTPPILGLVLVGMAGYYCNLSRFTWIFAPAIWAGVSYLVLPHAKIENTTRKRWFWALAFGFAGLLGGFIIPKVIPNVISFFQNPSTSINLMPSTSIQQPLLWDRLLPNPTYPVGILLGLVQAVLPLILILVIFSLKIKLRLDIWQKLAVFGSLLAFLVVGIIVSVKIGGGSNLHNLDMFLIGLIFLASILWEKGGSAMFRNIKQMSAFTYIVIMVAVLAPVYPAIVQQKATLSRPMEESASALSAIENYADQYSREGEILFIDNRQLLTFGYIKNVPLVPEYEKKVLMNEAMAENAVYFEPFYRDIMQKRFQLIITEPLVIKFQGEGYQFGNENDAWVKWVAIPLTCYYQPVETFEEVGVVLLVPRQSVLPDNGLCQDFVDSIEATE